MPVPDRPPRSSYAREVIRRVAVGVAAVVGVVAAARVDPVPDPVSASRSFLLRRFWFVAYGLAQGFGVKHHAGRRPRDISLLNVGARSFQSQLLI